MSAGMNTDMNTDMSVWTKQYPNAPLHDPAGTWFVNRKRELNLLWDWANKIPTKGSRSITGLRRTGKSTMMAKIYNRLYFEQERVMPIYITFASYLHRKEPITAQQFAEEFVAGAARSYLAFKYKRPELQKKKFEFAYLESLAEELSDTVVSEWYRRYQLILEKSRIPSHSVVQWGVDFLQGYAEEQPMLVMIDEFQVLTEVMYPEDNRIMDITDSFQRASESWDAPLLVSGSSISMLKGQALGGLLSGRFQPLPMGPLELGHAAKMVSEFGKVNGIPVTEEFVREMAKTTQGYPYSIESIMRSDSEGVAQFPDINAIEQVVSFELSNRAGALGQHYEEEYGKYVSELNGDNITRKILYWITNQDALKLQLHPKRVAAAINEDILVVQDSLEKLCRLDIIQRITGKVYMGPTDPLMKLYLNYWHYINVDDLSHDEATEALQRRYNAVQGELNRQTGHFTEIIVGGVMKAFDARVIGGQPYLSLDEDVTLSRFGTIHRRKGVIENGVIHEIDVIGEYRRYGLSADEEIDRNSNQIYGAWMVSVRYRNNRMGVKDVRQFMRDVEAVQKEKGYGEIVRWYFSKTGFTEDAKALLRREGIYHSDLAQFNQLAEMFDLLQLQTG
ncbi:MAG: ATP-binding protein [Chloroflexota bacterium]